MIDAQHSLASSFFLQLNPDCLTKSIAVDEILLRSRVIPYYGPVGFEWGNQLETSAIGRAHVCCLGARYCGIKQDLTLDHVVPTSAGGQWSWDNLVTACTTCNGTKGNKSLEQLGWKLRRQPNVR